ncbi:MAG: TraM recognition domain-containing protein, partial [Deltaproteobacteria bacterium]|nr:TraM recognition domain-containing protein [Deltaproteobacteria bacterium]
MEFAKIIKKVNSQEYAATFALRLRGMRVAPAEEQQKYENFAHSLLARQMDFIQALDALPPECAIDLRYLFDPQTPFEIKVNFLVRVTGPTRAQALVQADKLGPYLLHLLLIHNHLHDFVLVADPAELRYLIEPFKFRHLVEIIRREDLIGLETVKKKTTRFIGFKTGPTELPAGPSPEFVSQIYYVFPYTLHPDNLERLCNMLFLQQYPCLVSICLRPYRLTLADETTMEKRLQLCEKYSQLTFGKISEEVELLEPFLKTQATALYKHCAREYLQLQDVAFLLKVQLASSHPIALELANVVGTTITEHTGDPKIFLSEAADAIESSFTGGYQVYEPKDTAEFRIAGQNLKNLEFTPWIPSVSPHALRHWLYLFDVSEASAAFRLPIPTAGEFPGIDTTLHHHKPAPSDLPTLGLLLGEHCHLNRNRQVFFQPQDRRRHTYVVGKTGTGKSTLFLQMILQDIASGQALGIIDPHGELIEEVISCIPAHRVRDVVYVDPQDYEHPVGLNLLDYRTGFEKDFCVNYLIEVFDLLYDLKQTGGPIFEMYMRNALQLLLDQPEPFVPTVLDVPRVFQDRDFRQELLEKCTNVYVRNFWEKEASSAERDLSLENVTPYITSKLCRFVYNDLIRSIIGQRHTTINFRDVMNNNKILLVDLCKGLLGDTNSHFLGMLLVGKIFTAALSRTDVKDKSSLRDFYLYVDEFHNLATPTFISILSEARKYQLSLILTNQYIAQLKDYIINGIFGNIGTLISFRVGAGDAELLHKEFSLVISENDLVGLPNFHTYVKLLIDGNVSAPFNMRTLLPPKSLRPEAQEKIRQLS